MSIMPPAEVSTEKKKPRKNGRKANRTYARVKARLGKVKTDLIALGTFWGQVAGSAAVASTASGMLGNKIKLMAKDDGTGGLDARLALGAIGTGLKLSGKTGQWDSVVMNVTTGVLTSWLTEKSFAYGAELKAPAPVTASVGGEVEGTGGVVVGNIYGTEVGLFGSKEKRLERKEKRLEKKLAKVKAKTDDDDDDKPARVPGQVVMLPGGAAPARPWFRRGLPPRATVGPRGVVRGPRGRVLGRVRR